MVPVHRFLHQSSAVFITCNKNSRKFYTQFYYSNIRLWVYTECPESDLFGEKTLVAFGVQGHTEVPSAAARFPPHTQPASQFEKRRGLI